MRRSRPVYESDLEDTSGLEELRNFIGPRRIDGAHYEDGIWRLRWRALFSYDGGWLIKTRSFEKYCKIVILAISIPVRCQAALIRKPAKQAVKVQTLKRKRG